MHIREINKNIGTNSLVIIILTISFTFYNCKSSKQASRSTDYQELNEDEYFDEDGKAKSGRRLSKKTGTKSDNKAPKDKVRTVIKTARSYVGTPYRFGGTTRAGMDCSGLLFTTFKQVDVSLPRTSQQQSLYGKEIDIEDIQEGDLVFFSERKGGRKVNHVGMVTEVNGKDEVKFIHASTKLGVVENDLYSPYYIKLFIKAVRPF